MSMMRKAVLASALITSGLVSTAGMAMAHEDGGTAQKGLVNSSDFAPNTPVNVCNNDVPVNVLGVQVPIQDVAGNIPIASPAKHGENAAGNAKSCSNGVKAHN